MKILLTGTNGFIGTVLAEKLSKNKKYDLYGVVRSKKKSVKLYNYRMQLLEADLLNPKPNWRLLFKDFDVVIHLAGITKGLNKRDYFAGNLVTTRNLINAIKEYSPNLKQFIYISSQAGAGSSEKLDSPINETVKPHPVTYYGESKIAAELFIKDADIPYTIIRPTAVYGQGERDIFTYFKMKKWHISTLIKGEMRFFDIIYVKDLVDIIVKLIGEKKAINEIFFVSDGQHHTWEEFNEILNQILKKSSITIKLSENFLKKIGKMNDFLMRIFKKPFVLNGQKINELEELYWVVDISKIKKVIKWNIKYPLKKGIAETFKWYKDNKWL